jgi:23S rRNA (guanosine2251-2'-O)-methyltransferase
VSRLTGLHAILAALEAGGRTFDRIVLLRGRRDTRVEAIVSLARARRVQVRWVDRATLDRLAAGEKHQGGVALVSEVAYAEESDVLTSAGARPFLLVLDGIEDPRNLGAVVRTAAAAGVHGVFLPERSTVGASDAAARAAAGAMDRVRLVRTGNVAALLTRLQERGIWVVGIDAEGGTLWGGFDLTLPVALVVGSEGSGLRRLVRERCEVLLGVPMPGGGGSLNLSVAAAVAMYEVVRCRQPNGPPGRGGGAAGKTLAKTQPLC